MSGIETFLYALVALLVIIDPLGTSALFSAFIVLALFGVAGEWLLRALGIGLPAMRVAGGILLFISAADMVTAHGVMRATSDERAMATASETDISVFPLAIPLLAGPGSMTTMMLLHSRAEGSWVNLAALELALLVAMAGALLCLLLARHVQRVLGATGANVVGRVLGVLLAALAAQITIDGVRQSLNLP